MTKITHKLNICYQQVLQCLLDSCATKNYVIIILPIPNYTSVWLTTGMNQIFIVGIFSRASQGSN